jgi:hypothetical protein
MRFVVLYKTGMYVPLKLIPFVRAILSGNVEHWWFTLDATATPPTRPPLTLRDRLV